MPYIYTRHIKYIKIVLQEKFYVKLDCVLYYIGKTQANRIKFINEFCWAVAENEETGGGGGGGVGGICDDDRMGVFCGSEWA